MRTGNAAYIFLGLILGLITGFFLSNGVYRSEIEKRKMNAWLPFPATAASSLSNEVQVNSQTSEASLSPDELRNAIASADSDSQNLQKQRSLGLALYQYAVLEQNVELLVDVVRLLERAEKAASPQDKELLVTLGDAFFVLGQETDSQKIKQARAVYQKALKGGSKDADLHTKIGLTYFYAQPSEPLQAIKAYTQALEGNANHEKALENLILAQLELQKAEEAAANLKKLRQLNPQNTALSDLETQLAQQKIAAQK